MITNKTNNITIISTTIRNFEEQWKQFAENISHYNHSNIKLLVCDDRHNIRHEEYLKKYDIPFKVIDKNIQIDFFKKIFGSNFAKYSEIIKYDPSYKQMGFLIAAQDSDIIINIDDDVFPKGDFIGGHSIVNKNIEIEEVSSNKNWFNTCHIMKNNQNRIIYPRGYPYSKRKESYKYSLNKGNVVLNMGLWSGIPDLDAITFLQEDSGEMNGITDIRNTELIKDRLMIAKGTYLPLCVMNIGFSKKILPAYYQTLQSVDVKGWQLARYDDIWSGVFVKKVIDSIGDKVTVGLPLVKHEKTPRDIFEDIKKEFIGILVSQKLYERIAEIDINARDYFDGYSQLISGLREKEIYHDVEIQKYFEKLFDYMELWLQIVEKIM